MRPEEYAAILVRRWWLPLLGAVVAAAVGYALAAGQPAVYEAGTQMMAIAVSANPEKPESLYWPDLYAKNRLEAFRQMATSEAIAQEAVRRGGLTYSADELRGRTATRHNPSSNTIMLAVRDGDPARAARAANALADALVECLNSPACVFTPEAPQVKVVRLDQAGTPDRPTGARPWLTAAGAGVLGLVLGVLLAVLLEYLDASFRTAAEVRRRLDLPLLGRLAAPAAAHSRGRRPMEGERMGSERARLTMVTEPASELAEAYRVLRTNILFAGGERRLRSLLIAGIGRERATEVAANLAVATAQAGVRTVLIDAHLRDPEQHTIFMVPNDTGLATSLVSDVAPPVQATQVANLALLAAGPAPLTTSELLGSARMREVLVELLEGSELVILDAPPIGQMADGAVLATAVDGVLLVVRAGETRRPVAIEAKELLDRVGARILGTVYVEPRRRWLGGW